MLKLIGLLALCTVVYSQTCGMPAIPPIVANCDQNRIVGGCTATPYSWPWQIGFYESGSMICGGSIIDNMWIMTAGHCVYGNTNSPSRFTIRAGVFDHNSQTESGEQVAQVEQIFLHPNFSMSSISWDISLLKLATPLNYTTHISPVCVPKSDAGIFVEGADSWVTGWGTLHSGDFGLPKNLNQVRVPFLNQSHCDQEYGASAINDACMFCAGRTGEDSCQGDSGGPLVVSMSTPMGAAAGPWFEYGLVSWGYGCAEAGHAGVYSRVSAYCNFIDATLGKTVCM
jgi:secreted trypsin-like serine protease